MVADNSDENAGAIVSRQVLIQSFNLEQQAIYEFWILGALKYLQ
ncbi:MULTISPECIES: hypothetical protein [Nostocales]|uniref:Uncharacterized protein n=2 Tax=Nostocales TaxID=1161 RepID=A0ABW8WDQ8_9CYAN|nr:hypothetical protein [Tolypothrix bouteillei]